VRVTGRIEPDGGRLVPTLDEVTVGDAPFGDLAEHERQAARHLDRLTRPVRDAGMRFAQVRLEEGELRMLVDSGT
jgi:hypothetical protein